MGWPPCFRKGCSNWPAVGFTGVCSECIKVPEYVAEVAEEIFNNKRSAEHSDFERSCLLSFLSREPDGELLDHLKELMLSDPKYRNIQVAAEELRRRYWANELKGKWCVR